MADPLLDMLGVAGPAAPSQAAGAQDPLLSLVGVQAAQPAPQSAASPAAGAPAAPTSFLDGIGHLAYGTVKGAADLVQGPAQLILHGADWLYDKSLIGSKVPRGPAGNLLHDTSVQFDKHLADQERQYQADTPGSWSAGIGRVVPMTAAAIASGGTSTAPAATTLLARAGAGAAMGGAQGAITPVTGGDFATEKTKQIGAGAVVGGVLPGVVNLIGNTVVKPVVGAVKSAFQTAPTVAGIDATIDGALQPNGLKIGDLSQEVADSIRSDVAAATKHGGTLSPDAIRRLADYRMTGATPTAASLTLDPAMVSQQKNLAKLGINSKDVAAQQLGQVENANNRQLITGLNGMGADTAQDAVAGGQAVMGALGQRNARAQEIINQLYTQARAADGRSAALDPHAFTQKAGDALNEANLESFLTPDIRSKINGIAQGAIPLTVDVAEQLKTGIAAIQRNSADGNVRKALGLVRTALDDTPLQPGQELGQGAMDAFSKARSMNRAWMGIVEKTPALQAVRDGIEPDKFVQQFIVGNGGNANAMDVAMLKNSIKGSPEALTAVRAQITSYLKSKALNGAADEVGNFSQSAYNKALSAIGDRKLQLFFPGEDLAQLKAIGRVASYEQFQPRGSAVNNSNTASAGMSALLDRIANSPLLSKIPFGKSLAEPAQNISVGIKSGKALNVPGAMTTGPAPYQPLPSWMLMPATGAAINGQTDDQKKPIGLLGQ